MQHAMPDKLSDALRTEDRRERIIEALRQNDAVTVADLSEWLNVSDVTIRKDLQHLEDQGYLTRVRGGAVFSGRGQLELRFAARQQICLEEKRRIACAPSNMYAPALPSTSTPAAPSIRWRGCCAT